MAPAERAIDRYRRRLDPSTSFRSPAHVTVLFPFMAPEEITDAVLDELGELFGRYDAFPFSLAEVRWFDDRVVYLAPTPAAPFQELTAAVQDAFPKYPPYEGAFTEVIPHVCVGREARKLFMQVAGWLIKRHLPITGTVTEVWLMTIGDPEPYYRLRKAFPLRQG
jgi:2'-5' RNA ligase